MLDWNQAIRDTLVWLVPPGFILSIIIAILKYMPSWRNRITRELIVTVDRDGGKVKDGSVISVDVTIVITARHSEPIKILDLYVKYSEDIDGLSRHGMPLKGRYDLDFWNQETNGVFTHCKYVHFTFRRTNGFIQKFIDGEIKTFKVVVETNVYGTTASPTYYTSSLLNMKSSK